jgi:histidyl-tRNA synthetase
MKKRVERLRGMHDLLSEAYLRQNSIVHSMQAFLSDVGYMPVDTPILERSDLFLTSFGQELWQNLYAFRLHHRDLCLRPEYTASICRLFLDHCQQQALPLRFQYAGPIFRYEAPGRNRYRQHTQLGIELFGGDTALADAEILQLACEMLDRLRLSNFRLELGHIGVASGFIQRLHLDDQAAHLLLSLMEQISRSDEGEREAQARLEALYPSELSQTQTENSQRSQASDVETRYITSLLSGISISFGNDQDRSEIVERFLWKMGRSEQRRQILHALAFLQALHAISGPPPDVFESVRSLLAQYDLDAGPLAELEQLVELVKQCGVADEHILLNLSLGRGVSYYTGLVFEIHATDEDGFDAQLCGGGRYDHLMRAVGGNHDVNACGFAFGVERLLSLLSSNRLPLRISQAVVIPVSQEDVAYAFHIARLYRASGMPTEVDVMGHGLAAGLRLAAKKEIPLALIVGENERKASTITVRHMESGGEQIDTIEDLSERARKRNRGRLL